MMNAVLNPQQLRAFSAVVDSGGFTRAAKLLFLTQPGVSTLVSKLQRVVGVPLLVKDGRRMVPTEVGMSVYRYAREALASADTLQREVHAITTRQQNHFAIGTSPAYGTYVLPDLLAPYLREHPDVSLRLVESASVETVVQVRRSQLDVAIVLLSETPDDAVHLGTDELQFVESAARPVSRGRVLTLPELARVPFIRTASAPGQTASMRVDAFLAAAGLGAANVVMTVSTREAVNEAVRSGVGLAGVFTAQVHRELASGEFRTVTVEGYRDVRNICLLTSPQRRDGLPPPFGELVEWLRTQFPSAISFPEIEREA